MIKKKISIASCSGMSPHGLVGRAANVDTVNESKNFISICMTATSADIASFKELIKKFPIIAVNGCENACVNKILGHKGIKVAKTLNVMELLNNRGLKPKDVTRLDEEGERCVEVVKKKIKEFLDEYNHF